MWISALAVTAYLAPTALGFAFHDEVPVTGHLSIASEIENGSYPPRNLSFPELELRYHYGFDLLVAAVASLARLRVDHAIDVVTLLAWGYSWCLVWVTGERLIGRSWGAITAAVVLFGGGMPFFFSAPFQKPTFVSRLLGFGAVGEHKLNPPVVSYFFQHPWTLGIPLAFATILVVSTREAPDRWARWAAVGILLIALSFSQVVLFVCLLGALLVVELFTEARTSYRTALVALLFLGGATAVASRLHGFFATLPAGSERMFDFHPFALGGSPSGWVSWHLQTFGLLLPLGVAGCFLLPRERLLVGLLVIGSLGVLNAFRYRWSWDIVKFATVASLALAMGASATLRRLFELRPVLLGRAAGILAFVGLVASGVLFPLVIGFSGQPIPFPASPVALSPADELAVGWLRQNLRAGELVYRRGPAGLGYAQWGGLPSLVYDDDIVHHGLPPGLIEEWNRFVATPVREPDALLRHRVRWVILDRNDESLVRIIGRWTGQQRAVIRADFGSLAVVELVGEIPSPRESQGRGN